MSNYISSISDLNNIFVAKTTTSTAPFTNYDVDTVNNDISKLYEQYTSGQFAPVTGLNYNIAPNTILETKADINTLYQSNAICLNYNPFRMSLSETGYTYYIFNNSGVLNLPNDVSGAYIILVGGGQKGSSPGSGQGSNGGNGGSVYQDQIYMNSGQYKITIGSSDLPTELITPAETTYEAISGGGGKGGVFNISFPASDASGNNSNCNGYQGIPVTFYDATNNYTFYFGGGGSAGAGISGGHIYLGGVNGGNSYNANFAIPIKNEFTYNGITYNLGGGGSGNNTSEIGNGNPGICIIYYKNGSIPFVPPVNENTIITYKNLNYLDTNNVYVGRILNTSAYDSSLILNPSYNISFPASNTSSAGGDPLNECTSSEAIWYYAQLAIYNNNVQTIQEVLNSHAYCNYVKNKLITTAYEASNSDPNHPDYSIRIDFLYSSGLIGWQPTIQIPSSTKPLFSTNLYYDTESGRPTMATATDADNHILIALYTATKNYGINYLYYPKIPISYLDASKNIPYFNTSGQLGLYNYYNSAVDASYNYGNYYIGIQKLNPYSDISYQPQSLPTEFSNNFLLQAYATFLTCNISNSPYPYETNLTTDPNLYNNAGNGFYFMGLNPIQNGSSYPQQFNNQYVTGSKNNPGNMKLYNPIICNDQYGGGSYNRTALNPSYFDPVCMYQIYTTANELGFEGSTFMKNISTNTIDYPQKTVKTTLFSYETGLTNNYVSAIQNSIEYLINLQSWFPDPKNINSYGLPDNPYWTEKDNAPFFPNTNPPQPSPNGGYSTSQGSPTNNPSGPHYVGFDSIRTLQNFGYFAYLYYKGIIPSNELFGKFYTYNGISSNGAQSLIIIGIRMMNYVIANSENQFDISMNLEPLTTNMSGGSLIGPLCVGMIGLYPYYSQVTDTNSPYYSNYSNSSCIAKMKETLNRLTDNTVLFNYDHSNSNLAWQNWQNAINNTSAGKPNNCYYPTMLALYCKYLVNEVML
jgi:hypothetical protein